MDITMNGNGNGNGDGSGALGTPTRREDLFKGTVELTRKKPDVLHPMDAELANAA